MKPTVSRFDKEESRLSLIDAHWPLHGRVMRACLAELPDNPHWAPERSCLHVWAPVVTAYVTWVLREAQKRGTKRLYFLSRDGYPLYRAAQTLLGEESPLELRYLRVSRYSLRLPELALKSDTCPDWLFLCGIDVTMRKILRRGGLTETELNEATWILGFDRSLDDILTRPEIRCWELRAQAAWPRLAPLFQKHGEQALLSARGYLCQEGLSDEISSALVDSGWMGSTQASINRLIPDRQKPLEGYYFGLYDLPAGADPSRYHTFYFRPGTDILRKADFCNCLFEAVLSEPAGMTMGYRSVHTTDPAVRYLPLLSDTIHYNDRKINRLLPQILTYASRYGEALRKEEMAGTDPEIDTGDRLCRHVLTRFMLHPTPGEAAWYGTLRFCDDMLEDASMQEVAAHLSYREIRNLEFTARLLDRLGLRHRIPHESGWIYGSIVRRGTDTKQSLEAARRYRRLLYLRKYRPSSKNRKAAGGKKQVMR